MAVVKTKFDQSAQDSVSKKKNRKWLWWVGGIFAFFVVFLVLFYQPVATIHYGICKAYIELNEPYPSKIRYLGYVAQGNSTEVYFRSTDPFGVISVNKMECFFEKDQQGGMSTTLARVDLNGRRSYSVEDPEKVKAFNKTVPAIIASQPNLVIPTFPLQDISRYREFHDDNM